MRGSHPNVPSTFKWLKTAIVLTIWTVVALLSVPFLLFVTPDIETRLAPILRNQTISDVMFLDKDGEYLLWRWNYDKVRYGRPEYFAFMAYDIRNPVDRYSVNAYSDWSCQQNLKTLRGAPQGERIYKEMCVRLPNALRGNEWVAIDGVIDYSLRHPFYTLLQRVPEADYAWPVIAQQKKAPAP